MQGGSRPLTAPDTEMLKRSKAATCFCWLKMEEHMKSLDWIPHTARYERDLCQGPITDSTWEHLVGTHTLAHTPTPHTHTHLSASLN